MLSEILPSPELHDDWRSFARALIASLDNLAAQSAGAQEITYIVNDTPITTDQLPQVPAGWAPLWLNTVDANLYLANPDYDPPTAPNIVFIDTANIANAAIEANKVATGAITTAAILDGAVTSLELAAAAVGNVALAANAVGSANIIDAAIIAAKIGTAAVITAKIQDAAILTAKIGDAQILNAKILDATILGAKIANGTIVSALIGDAQIVEAKIGALAVNEAKIANLAVTSGKIANLAVGTAHIQSAAITQALIANAAIITAHIGDAQITNAKIADTIQSSGWNSTTKAGWRINKAGLIEGQGIAIYDISGNLVFGSGGTVSWQAITGYDPGSAGNRVKFSQQELGTFGWYLSNPYGLAGAALSKTSSGGRPGIRGVATFTANGQIFGVYTYPASEFDFPVLAGEKLAVAVRVSCSGGTNWYCFLDYFDSVGTFLGSSPVLLTGDSSTSTTTRKTAITPAAPAGAVIGRLAVILQNEPGITGAKIINVVEPFVGGAADNQTVVQDFTIGPNGFVEQFSAGNISTYIANAAIGTALIADASITTAKIGNLQVTNAHIADATIQSAKIVSLDAAKINAASLSAITATIGLLRTASSGARLEIESNQIRVYDSSNVLRVRMGVW